MDTNSRSKEVHKYNCNKWENIFLLHFCRLCQGILLQKPNKWDYTFWWSLQFTLQTNNEISATLQGTWYYNFTTDPVWKGLLECDVPLQRGTFLKTCRGFGALQLTTSTVWCTSRVVNIENLNWCADRSDQGECIGIGSKSQVSLFSSESCMCCMKFLSFAENVWNYI